MEDECENKKGEKKKKCCSVHTLDRYILSYLPEAKRSGGFDSFL